MDSMAMEDTSKEKIKEAIKEVNAEKDMGYTINNRSKEELKLLIKMAQAKLANWSDDKKSTDVLSPSC
jgi:hypothetical protein